LFVDTSSDFASCYYAPGSDALRGRAPVDGQLSAGLRLDSDLQVQAPIEAKLLEPGAISLNGFFVARSCQPHQQTLNVGRSLVPNLTRTQSVRLEQNDERRYDRVALLDLRVGRVFKVGDWRFEHFVDAYNLFNANTIVGRQMVTGPTLGRVSTTINSRVIRIGGRMDF
jgi:hypothetical protein